MKKSHEQWITPFAVQLIPAGVMFIGLFFIKEFPRWLMSRNQRAKALKNLCWIRKHDQNDMYMLEEVSAIDAALEHQHSTVGLGFWQPFQALWKDRKVSYRFFLGCSLFFWQNISGINAINYYSLTVFKSIGATATNTSLLTTGVFGLVKAVVTLVWLFFLIDNLGKRNLLMYGAFGGALCLYYVGAYIRNRGYPPAASRPCPSSISRQSSTPPVGTAPPGSITLRCFRKTCVHLVKHSSLLPTGLFNFLVARFTAQMFTAMGYGVYMFFASLMILSIGFCVLFIARDERDST